MSNGEHKSYIGFMLDPTNSHKCGECPENIGESAYQDRLPCGQWNCWVDCHTRHAQKEMP